MSAKDLKNLLKNGSISLKSGRSGVKYTEAETNLATAVAASVLTACSIGDFKDKTTDEVNEALQVEVEAQNEAGQKLSVPGLCRGTYHRLEAVRLGDDSTKNDFPMVKKGTDERTNRDYTGLTLFFRKAFTRLGVDEEIKDEAFPSPYKKKTKSA